MKQTNYHLFDFMDFSPFERSKNDDDLSWQKEETLWKAYAPTKVSQQDGDILVTLPFQQQLRQEDMAPDNLVPQQIYTLIIRAYQPDIIRLFISMNGDEIQETSMMLDKHDDVRHEPLDIKEEEAQLFTIIDSEGRIRAVIDNRPYPMDHWSDLLPTPQPAPFITLYPDGDSHKPVALSDDHFSPPRYDALPIGYVSCKAAAENKTASNERATISFRCTPDECFVGTGERFRKMDLSGQTFQLKNQDGQGVNNRRCYKNIPFYLSSRMYGAFYHTYDYCKLSLADHSTRSVQFLCDRATLDVFLIGGKTPERILRTYRMLTGFPPMLPLWSFGIWMSRMTYFSAEEVNDICNRLRREHYPCDVIHLDTGWFRTDWLCEWQFNPERFPHPKEFIQDLLKKGFKVSLWQLPYVAAGAEQIDEAKQNKFISQPAIEKDSSTGGASNFSTLDYAGTIDFTYPQATKWYKEKLLKPLLEMGVKCIKTDFGENIHMDHVYHAMTPEQLNNIYALLYQKAAFEVTKDTTGDGIVWARAAWAGCQRYPLHWGGDSQSSWDGMAGSLKGGLHLGLSGFAFWSHDVPGFHSTPDFMNSPLDEQVYVRWTQFGVFSSHIRYHGTCKREPWHYPTIAPIVKKWWKLRYHLLPYIMEQAEKSTHTGWPMVRALLMHHPNDRTCWHIDDEYYFGDSFLVCPVMNSNNRRDIYLPKGMWIDFFTGERFDGGKWYYDVEVPLERMPVFVRQGEHIRLYPEEVESTDDIDLSKSIILDVSLEFQGLNHSDITAFRQN